VWILTTTQEKARWAYFTPRDKVIISDWTTLRILPLGRRSCAITSAGLKSEMLQTGFTQLADEGTPIMYGVLFPE